MHMQQKGSKCASDNMALTVASTITLASKIDSCFNIHILTSLSPLTFSNVKESLQEQKGHLWT